MEQDIKVQCKCKWQGKQSELKYKSRSDTLHCPKCNAEFIIWDCSYKYDVWTANQK